MLDGAHLGYTIGAARPSDSTTLETPRQRNGQINVFDVIPPPSASSTSRCSSLPSGVGEPVPFLLGGARGSGRHLRTLSRIGDPVRSAGPHQSYGFTTPFI